MNIICVILFSLQLLSETFLILRRNERNVDKKVYWSSCKVSVILLRSYRDLNFLERFSKNTQISSFMKIRAVGAELFHADRRTGMSKLLVAFRNLTNAPKKLHV
jgi:hypothetical protein